MMKLYILFIYFHDIISMHFIYLFFISHSNRENYILYEKKTTKTFPLVLWVTRIPLCFHKDSSFSKMVIHLNQFTAR